VVRRQQPNSDKERLRTKGGSCFPDEEERQQRGGPRTESRQGGGVATFGVTGGAGGIGPPAVERGGLRKRGARV
jgi:hypothetical protein